MSIQKYEELHDLVTNFGPLLETCDDDRQRVLVCAGMLMMQIRLMEDFRDTLHDEELKVKMGIIISAVFKTGEKIIQILSPDKTGGNHEAG